VPKLAESTIARLTKLTTFPQPELIRTRYPVVLLHGFGSLASIRRHGHLHDEAMHLRGHGVLAYAPNVVPYNTVTVRSKKWKQCLQEILKETKADKLNIIAQSMGGLDARYLISRLGMAPHVASLVTISTPHHGSTLAEFVLRQPQVVQEWTAAIANWMGTNSIPDSESDFATAVAELTPHFVMNKFNPMTPDDPTVRYWSYAGCSGKDADSAMNPFLRVLNGIVYEREGPNDGFVSVESAKWGEFLGTINADHAEQVGIRIIPGGKFDSHAFYSGVAKMLSDEGL
jgi:triacylglycerol lipase